MSEMYNFKDKKLADLANEVKSSWPKFLEVAFSTNIVGDAMSDHEISEKKAVERELIWMQDNIESLLKEVRLC